MHPDTIKLIREMVSFIKAYQVEWGTSPSQKEIAAAIKRSPGGITALLNKAQAKGYIKRNYMAHREIEVLAILQSHARSGT